MPSGKIHLRIEVVALALCIGVLLLVRNAIAIRTAFIVLFSISYCVSMLLLSPDLDLADSRATRRWGPLRFLWFPYAALFKHRQISHQLLLGPLTRILYFLALLLGIAYLAVAAVGLVMPISSPPRWALAPVALGLYLPNVIHILADRVHTATKHRDRR